MTRRTGAFSIISRNKRREKTSEREILTTEEGGGIQQGVGLIRLEVVGRGGGARRGLAAAATASAARRGALLLHASPL